MLGIGRAVDLAKFERRGPWDAVDEYKEGPLNQQILSVVDCGMGLMNVKKGH